MVAIAQLEEHLVVVQGVTGSIPVSHPNTEGARMDEDTDLKSAGCKSLGGSIPSSSAKVKRTVSPRMETTIGRAYVILYSRPHD